MNYLSEINRIGVLMFTDPYLGLTLEQAQKTLLAVINFNTKKIKYATNSENAARPQSLSRLGFTGQISTTTKWKFLVEFMAYAAQREQPPVHIYGDLKCLTPREALNINKSNGRLYGEWFAPSLDSRGAEIMVKQGIERIEAGKMLVGILMALSVGALTGLEFQINKKNICYVEDFIKLCRKLNIEAHLEMQETPFSRDQNLSVLKEEYRHNSPSRREIRDVAKLAALSANLDASRLLSPFFDYGGRYGVCNYWFENGLFIRPKPGGGLYRTVCLSDQTIIDPDFKPSVLNLVRNTKHPLLLQRLKWRQPNKIPITGCQSCDLWSNCLGGCRAMAYLSAGHDDCRDPHCWRRDYS